MTVEIKEKTNGRFYVAITVKKQRVFKTMSFKSRNNAREYACEFLDAFSEREKETETSN